MRLQSVISVVAGVMLSTNLGGCAFFPVAGPQSEDIKSGYSSVLPYIIVPLTQQVVDVLDRFEPKGIAGVFSDRRPPSFIKFGIGDVVAVTIFEAAAGGLYIPSEAGVRPGNYVTIPDQAVDNDGNISVPYAGTIKANNRTNVQIQNDIVAKIKNRAIDPQVIVSLSSQRTNLVSVLGEVALPIRFAAAASGASDRISDALTRAGGIKGQGYETWVTLQRGSKSATVPFENLITNADNNVYVQPGDRIYVYREQQKFIAFGASGLQGEFNFDAWRINLGEAVAKAGGLLDAQGDPGSVFLYRREPREVAEQLGADISAIPGKVIPVIFKVSFRDPGGYFLATKTVMRNQDVIFVANAKSVEITKFLQFVNLVTNTALNTLVTVQEGYAVRAAGQASSTAAGVSVSTTTATPAAAAPVAGVAATGQ